jgi:hypothetical protein
MASYFTTLFFGVKMTQDQFDWLERLHNANYRRVNDESPVGNTADLADALAALAEFDDCSLERLEYEEDDQAAIFSDCEANVEYVAHLCQEFLIKFEIAKAITFEYANTCSRDRLDAYGGGAFVVTRESVRGMSTGQWINETLAALETGAPT